MSLRSTKTGLLLQVAEEYYNIELAVNELPVESWSKDEYKEYKFRLNFNNRDYLASRETMKGSHLELEKKMLSCPSLSSRTLLRLFPFALVFNSDLKIIGVGKQLKVMFPYPGLTDHTLPELVKMRRPKVGLTWENVIIFIIKELAYF